MRSSNEMDTLLRQQKYIDINMRSQISYVESVEPDFRYIGPIEMRDMEKASVGTMPKDKTLKNSREFMKSFYKDGQQQRDPLKDFNIIISTEEKKVKASD